MQKRRAAAASGGRAPAILIASAPFASALQAALLALHVLDHHIVDLAERGAVGQHLPRLVGMEMDLDERLIPHAQQAVARDVRRDMGGDGVLRQPLALDQQLRIVPVFQHGRPPLCAIGGENLAKVERVRVAVGRSLIPAVIMRAQPGLQQRRVARRPAQHAALKVHRAPGQRRRPARARRKQRQAARGALIPVASGM